LNWETKPMKNATSIIDSFSWISLALAISSLLYKREITWKWDLVTVSMLSSGIQLLEQNLIETSITKNNPTLVWNWDSAIFPFWFFKVQDWEIALAIWNDNLWNIFTQNIVLDLKWKFLSNDDRLKNKDYLTNIIEKEFIKYKKDELCLKLEKLWIPNWKINSILDLINDEKLFKNNFIKKIKHKKLWECVVPYEFTKYSSYNIEKIKKAPDIWENNKEFNLLENIYE
jgi:crotonobetainyl-CoA:carnitine CoA-transferase CaiB-like acyl-CoA transferase